MYRKSFSKSIAKMTIDWGKKRALNMGSGRRAVYYTNEWRGLVSENDLGVARNLMRRHMCCVATNMKQLLGECLTIKPAAVR